MSGDKTTAQEQATGSLGQMAPGQGTQHCAAEGRKVACSHWALCSSGGVQEVDFGRWAEPRMLVTATPPPKEITLYGTNKVGVGVGQAQGQIQQEGGSRR